MSKSLGSIKSAGERKEVAEHRYRTCDKGKGKSGLGYWAAVDYLKKGEAKK